MPSIRIQRMEKELLKLFNNVINYKLRDKNLQWVSISEVKLSKDLSHARIYFTFLNKGSKKKIEQVLTKSSGFFKKEIASSKLLRVIPELSFFYDDLEENARHLEDIFAKIHAEENES